MAFTKYATISVSKLTSATWSGDSLAFDKTAANGSMYGSNTNVINVRELLGKVASEYEISADPKDYIFEAVRAVTAEVPNQNADEFSREELLRFDHKIGQKVYQTFILKPHQINHRADNPKTARGVVLDAYYNDTSKALDTCPSCNNRTAEVSGRDSSGLNCSKCGTTVKDEFVELLLAVDTKKDPIFADGVKSGALDSLSMGCLAMYTDCSICNNRAHTASDFCSHIRGGNKKKMFKTGSGEKMAYERCGGVTFTEISRVDQPADPTAKQKELFSLSAMPLQVESEMLMMSAKIAKLEAQISKKAQVDEPSHPQVPFKTVAESIKWAQKSISTLRGNIARLTAEKEAKIKSASEEGRPFYAWENAAYTSQIKANLQYISRLENYVTRAAGLVESGQPWGKDLTRSMSRFFANKVAQSMPEDLKQDLDELGRAHPEMYNDIIKDLGIDPNDPNMTPGSTQPQGMSMGQYQEKQEQSLDQNMTAEEMGIKVDEGTKINPAMNVTSTIEEDLTNRVTAILEAFEENDTVTTTNLKFADTYKHLEASVTKGGNVKVFTKAGTLFVVRPAVKPADEAAGVKLATEVLASIAEDGIVGAVAKYKTVLGPKFAQVLQFHMEDFDGGREDGDKKPSHEGGENDLADDREKPEMSLGKEETDRKDEERDERDQSNADTLEEHEPDHKEKLPKGLTPATEEEHSDRAESREKKPKTTLDDNELDHKGASKAAAISVPYGMKLVDEFDLGDDLSPYSLFVDGQGMYTMLDKTGFRACKPDRDMDKIISRLHKLKGVDIAGASRAAALPPEFLKNQKGKKDDKKDSAPKKDKKAQSSAQSYGVRYWNTNEGGMGRDETIAKILNGTIDHVYVTRNDPAKRGTPDINLGFRGGVYSGKNGLGFDPNNKDDPANWTQEIESKTTQYMGRKLSAAELEELFSLIESIAANSVANKSDAKCECGVDAVGGGMHSSWCPKYKKAQVAPGADAGGMQVCALGDMCADVNCPEHGKGAQAPGGMQMAPGAPPAAPAAPGMAPMAMTAADKTYVSRMERLYKNRMKTTAEDYSKKLAEADKTAAAKIASKFTRALKLAAKRQAVNLEVSPIKSAMFDVLTSEVDIDSDSFFPGMDAVTASKLIEATSTSGFDSFVDSLVKRASEFVAMSDDAFTALEADVKNLQPASVVVQASAEVRTASVKNNVRQAAVEGNMAIAPSPVEDIISRNTPRNSIRSALGATKVHRATQNLSKK